MEKEVDSTTSGRSDDRDDSKNMDTVPEGEHENDTVEENDDEHKKGVISIQLSKSSIFKMYLFMSRRYAVSQQRTRWKVAVRKNKPYLDGMDSQR